MGYMTNSERWYSLGRCAGCGRDIVRWHRFRGDVGRTLTFVCGCAPRLEAKMKVVSHDGKLVIWDEVMV
jgi:hypothetical protein